MQSYEKIWERDGRWLMGPGLLADIIEFVRDKAPIASWYPNDRTRVSIAIPLPQVLNEVTGSDACISLLIPPELRAIFFCQCDLCMADWYDDTVHGILHSHLDRPSTGQLLASLNNALANVERKRVACGDEPALWEIVARRFGFSPLNVPAPARVALLRW